jgi:2-iminoacetate synthase
MHPSGPKRIMTARNCYDRAMKAESTMSVLRTFGLYDHSLEVLALLFTPCPEELSELVSTISCQESARNGHNLETFPYLVNDEILRKLLATIRLAIPYTGMILSHGNASSGSIIDLASPS